MPESSADSFAVLSIADRLIDRPPIDEPRVQPTTAAQLADDLQLAGIAPDRASCPNLVEQLRQADEMGVDSIICCAIDGDPLMPINATVAREQKADVAEAMKLLAKLVKPKRVLLVAEPAVVARCKSTQKSCLPAGMFKPVPLRADYPLTDARLLVRTVLRRKVKPRELPTAARTIVIDAVAAAAIGQWSRTGSADPTTPLAVRDHVASRVRLVRVPRGAKVGEVLDSLHIPAQGSVVRSGDFLRDCFVTAAQSLGNGELCLHITAPQLPEPAEPCIRCAWCVEACPARIQPAGLLEASQRDDLPMAERFGLHACIECGICSYVCPSHLPLLPAIRQLLATAGKHELGDSTAAVRGAFEVNRKTT